MRRPVAVLLALAALTGCTPQDAELPADRLEDEVAALYPAADPGTRVAVRCDGPLAGQLGATQECRVAVRRDVVAVRVTVTDESEDGPVFEAVRVLPADQVAQTVLDGLVREEYVVGEVVCEGELLGVVGEAVDCTATPPEDGPPTPVVATVRAVDGLDVRIRYRLPG